MAPFWQISGPGSHLRRDWRDGKNAANSQIAETIFNTLSIKSEAGTYSLDLILGIELSGASQILIPYHWRDRCRYLNWMSHADAYPCSRFASLSPIHVETPLRLQMLLEERQKVSKATQASKHKDTSKLNGRFWNCPPNPSRAAFEHGRCLWRIIQNEFQPRVFGLPEAQWNRDMVIFSLALNFWAPDGIHFTTQLIDASLTKTTKSNGETIGTDPTWYFVAKENTGLQNSFHAEDTVVQEKWHTKTLSQDEIGRQIQILLDAHSQPESSPAPLILLVHDYNRYKESLAAFGGLTTREWVFGLTELLAFHKDDRQFKQKGYITSSRKRSCSPRGLRSNSIPLKREPSPSLQQLRTSVYVVDTMEMFKTMSESGVLQIRPVAVYNAITGRDERDTWCAGDDSHYILQSWKGMVQGPTIDEQRAFYGDRERSTCPTKDELSDIQGGDTEPPEATDLYGVQQEVSLDKFNAGSDAGSDEEWYSITRAD